MIDRLTIEQTLLLDALGAGLSAASTGLILPQFASHLGLEPDLLRTLALFPVVYAVFGFGCLAVGAVRRWMLIVLIAANSLYLAISIGIMVGHKDIAALGQLVLASEALVLVGVIAVEVSVFRRG